MKSTKHAFGAVSTAAPTNVIKTKILERLKDPIAHANPLRGRCEANAALYTKQQKSHSIFHKEMHTHKKWNWPNTHTHQHQHISQQFNAHEGHASPRPRNCGHSNQKQRRYFARDPCRLLPTEPPVRPAKAQFHKRDRSKLWLRLRICARKSARSTILRLAS